MSSIIFPQTKDQQANELADKASTEKWGNPAVVRAATGLDEDAAVALSAGVRDSHKHLPDRGIRTFSDIVRPSEVDSLNILTADAHMGIEGLNHVIDRAKNIGGHVIEIAEAPASAQNIPVHTGSQVA